MLAAPTRAYYGDPVLVTPPDALPLSLAELKAHCRVDLADEDALLMGYLRAAVGWVEQYTGLALITQTWRETVNAFPAGAIELRKRPLQAVTSIDYLDANNVSAVLDPSVYVVSGVGGDKRPARLSLGTSQAWPTVYAHSEAVSITYRVGFGDTHNEVPELIRHALLLLVSTWYDYRQDVVAGSVGELPAASKALIAEWRPFGVA